MARGNQRDKAREKNQKDAAGQVRKFMSLPAALVYTTFQNFRIVWKYADISYALQKKKNTVCDPLPIPANAPAR